MAKRLQRNAPRAAAAGSASAADRDSTYTPERRGSGAGRLLRGRVADRVVTDFTSQLATLAGAGIPLVRALTILEGQMAPGPFKAVLGALVDDVSAGVPLSEAMGKHERVFDPLYSSMVRAGEAGGVLDRILRRLASFRENSAQIRGRIRNALIYPAVIVVVAVGVVSAVIVLVIPKFEEIFESFNTTLPRATQLLLDTSRFMVQWWAPVFGIPLLLAALHFVFMRRAGRYRFFVHGIQLRLPVVGGVLRQTLVAGFARTFGTLIEAGVPHLDALGIVRDTAPNDVLAEGVEDIRRTVREGEGIARPMGESGVFDDLVVNMVDVGEATGELDNMLLQVADAYEQSVDRKLEAMFKLLEPVLLLVMAVFVGFIVVALFLPLMDIMSQLDA